VGRLLDIVNRHTAAAQAKPAVSVRTVDTDTPLCTVDLAGRQYPVHRWTGQQLPDTWLSLDTETDMIQGREIPRLHLVSIAGNQDSCCLLRPDQLADFISLHADRHYICHHAAFDFWVVRQHLAGTTQEHAWWDIAAGRLHDTMLLDQLLRIAQTDEYPVNRNLAEVAKHYCGLNVDKSDSHRTRFAELSTDWSTADPGFFRYAARDALATLYVYLAQTRLAQALFAPYQLQVLPNAQQLFGVLTETVQVRAAIALAAVHRNGVQVDLAAARQVQDDTWRQVDTLTDQLQQLATGYGVAGLFKYAKRTGNRKQTPAGVPQRCQTATQQVLAQIAHQHSMEDVPSTTRGLSDSAEYWQQHRHLAEFVDVYCTWQQQAKLATFFAGLKTDRIHPHYQVLVRTGRTSASSPNIQQLPRSQTVRHIITVAPGYQLLSADYSCLELRTLAQVCLRRYGKSTLAEMFQANPEADPHSYTAARLLGISDPHFQALPDAERKQHRQQAKAVNFGVPGGLGAESLARYANDSYGVDLTLDRAKELRGRICNEVYPELGRYLAGGYGNEVAVCTLTGRIRSTCGYTQARNTPFSGLAADGAKLALFELVRRGYRLCAFIHDEVLIEVPDDSDGRQVSGQVQDIMQQAMQQCTPDIPITTSTKLARTWEH
jgi:DNA polymerase I-like protein with 3'-5' exonuclease and polymerase domains